MATDWRSAYFEQAKSDYWLFRKFVEQDDVPLCQKLHYLQMTTEKMSKGFLTPAGYGKYNNTHNAFALFVVKAGDMNGLRRIRNITRKSAFNAYLNGLRPTAMAIEDLSPEGPSHPNPEYPWEVNGRIITPIAHDFPNLKLSNIAMKKMLDFLESCFKLIERES